MDTLPAWAWRVIAAVLLLVSPAFAFLFALLVEILLGIVKEGGGSALASVIAAGAIGWLLRQLRVRSSPRTMAGDQA
jgi:uncharacterized membrane protein YjjB (DUF3815 family)